MQGVRVSVRVEATDRVKAKDKHWVRVRTFTLSYRSSCQWFRINVLKFSLDTVPWRVGVRVRDSGWAKG
jgi:hypothetical protein